MPTTKYLRLVNGNWQELPRGPFTFPNFDPVLAAEGRMLVDDSSSVPKWSVEDREAVGIYEVVIPDPAPNQIEESPPTYTTNGDGRPVVATHYVTNYPDISGAQWFTLVKGLASANRTTLRNAVSAGLAVTASDGDSDAVYLAAKRQNKAAKYLNNDETDKSYPLVIAALSLLGLTLTGSLITGFQNRWLEVSLL